MIDPQWVQGSLLDPNAARKFIADEDATENDVLIVISQSCDVVHFSYETEPHVELHVGRPIDASDGNNTFGKNPRILDLETNINGAARKLRILAHERKAIPRQTLEGLKPIGALSEDDTYRLAKWTGARYTRPALPDAFNERRKMVRDAISKLAKKNGKDIVGFYVGLKTFDELPAGTDYEVAFLGVTPTAVANDPSRFQEAITITTVMANLLATCPGIRVIDIDTRSTANTSLDDVRFYKRLDLDYISEREGGEGPIDPV